MNTTTLRGVFPEPKPVHRKNFVRENIRYLKEMQGYAQTLKSPTKSQEMKANKFKHIAPRVYSHMNARTKLSKIAVATRPVSHNQITKKFRQFEQKLTHRGVQTERPEDVKKMYETGNFKYPTGAPPKTPEQGDSPNKTLAKSMQKLDLDDKQNFIKQNIKNVKSNKQKVESHDPLLPPPNYQKGALPKYMKEKKESPEEVKIKPVEFEGEQVPGLVLLPDEERKEYLRVARENYAGLIKELNSMPVSNDTLRKRKRKMEIEDELKRLEEVIKIFQKPKVFVKADA